MQQFVSGKTPFWLRQRTIFIIYFVIINALNIQSVITNRMVVWKIFRQSFYHLIQQKDLYLFYPQEYIDQYLYSPSFPVLFAPFSLLPYYIGYFLWNNISMLSMPYLIYKLKGIDVKKKSIICYIALLEMATCLQGTQTNVIIAALILLSFISFENKNYWLAAFAIAAGTYIKVYPIVAVSLFLLYPNKFNFLLKFVAAMLVIAALPLLFISPPALATLYHNWFTALVIDQGDNYGKISITGFIEAYFHITDFAKLMLQLFGVIIFCLMYMRYKLFALYKYRLYFLCAIFIWVTIFNHASEIYGYAVAIWGVGIWYALQKPNKALNLFICLFIFFATVLSIDPTPHIILDYIYEHGLKALPFAIMLVVIIWQMLRGKDADFSIFENDKFVAIKK